jgi:hypothetical protein
MSNSRTPKFWLSIDNKVSKLKAKNLLTKRAVKVKQKLIATRQCNLDF